jgi:serine/threonine-protein kinase HipA
MSLNGKRDDFVVEDFRQCAESASMKRGRAEEIVGEVRSAVAKWLTFADEAAIPEPYAERIAIAHRLYLPL